MKKRIYYNYVKWKNYHWSGVYHITLVTNQRGTDIFGKIEGDTAETAHIVYTDLGAAVMDCVRTIPNYHPQEGLVIEAATVMPDHIHFVLHVMSDLHTTTFGQIINGLKTGINKAYQQAQPNRSAVGNTHLTWQEREQLRGTGLLQQGFYVRILLPNASLSTMINYVNDNPRRAWLKHHHRDLFTLKRGVHVNAQPNRNAVGNMHFSALGNIFLLDYPCRQVVECSRTIHADRLALQLEQTMLNAEAGAVTYTAAINEGERTIVRAVREAGYPLVILLKDGFPKEGSEHERYYKPGGVYFDACAKGRLLLLEPVEETMTNSEIIRLTQADLQQKTEAKHYSFAPIPTSSQRYRYVALNTIAKLLCQ